MSNDEGTSAEKTAGETEQPEAAESVTEENGDNNDDEEEANEVRGSSVLLLKDPQEQRHVSKLQSLVVVRGLPVVAPSVASIVREEELDSKREVVKFASRFTAIAYPPEKDASRMLKPLSEDAMGAWRKYMRLDSENQALRKEYVTQFTQTFFKALTKVSNRRLIEILAMNIDYEDISLVFYCTSDELITNSRGSEEELETKSPE